MKRPITHILMFSRAKDNNFSSYTYPQKTYGTHTHMAHYYCLCHNGREDKYVLKGIFLFPFPPPYSSGNFRFQHIFQRLKQKKFIATLELRKSFMLTFYPFQKFAYYSTVQQIYTSYLPPLPQFIHIKSRKYFVAFILLLYEKTTKWNFLIYQYFSTQNFLFRIFMLIPSLSLLNGLDTGILVACYRTQFQVFLHSILKETYIQCTYVWNVVKHIFCIGKNTILLLIVCSNWTGILVNFWYMLRLLYNILYNAHYSFIYWSLMFYYEPILVFLYPEKNHNEFLLWPKFCNLPDKLFYNLVKRTGRCALQPLQVCCFPKINAKS